MQLRPSSPDALLSFSDFLLERFGLVASMQVAVIASLALHAAIVVGLGFKIIVSRPWDAPHNMMDVVLVNSKSATKPTNADALAQANLDGGGNTDEKLRAKSPLPNLEDQARELRESQALLKQLEQAQREMMTRMKSSVQVTQAQPEAKRDANADAAARDLMQSTLEMERLQAQIAQQQRAYQERPKKKFIGARVEESRHAVYVDAVREKIERIGTTNLQARRDRVYGILTLTVGIRANGEIESVEVNRSSKNKALDQMAMKIVRLAGPFDRFPDNIKGDMDILYLTRTYSFTRQDQLVVE